VSCWAPVRNKLSFSGQLWPPASTWASPRSVALIQKPGGRSVVVQSRITRLIASTRAIIVHSIGTPTSAHSTRPLCKHLLHTHTHTILNPSTTAYPRRDRRRIIRTTPILRIHVLALHASPFAESIRVQTLLQRYTRLPLPLHVPQLPSNRTDWPAKQSARLRLGAN
jgi:hypothetical protein